jgi:hypothetical protein
MIATEGSKCMNHLSKRLAPVLSEIELEILHLETGLELQQIALRLWADGEREVALDCLRIAARCELSEAEIALAVWEATGGKEISACTDVPDVQAEADVVRSRPVKIPAQRFRTVAKVAAGAMAITAALVAGHQLPSGDKRNETSSPITAQVIRGQETSVLPQTYARLTPEPAMADAPASSGGSAAAAPPPARQQFHIDVDPAQDYMVTLRSADRHKPCSWRIVGTASEGPKGAAQVDLRPGELQQVKVPAGGWSSLSVFSDVQDRPGACPVLGGKPAPQRHPSTPVTAEPDTSPSAAPAPTEATVTPTPVPSEEPHLTTAETGPTGTPSLSTP